MEQFQTLQTNCNSLKYQLEIKELYSYTRKKSRNQMRAKAKIPAGEVLWWCLEWSDALQTSEEKSDEEKTWDKRTR